ncbi:EF-hand [Pluteus cervinus]|uniref:EF-hand n=1 Tax=Pluteus cervinus TaxID=181527 RepID=A0ACD3AZ79_9AGAR|nr:EF-hand [Pluteus cervinus]
MSYGGYNQGYGAPAGGHGGHGGGGGQGYGAPAGAPGGYGPGGQYGGAPVGYGGGFAPPPARGPPPGADPQLWNWFSSVDTDRSGAITAPELEKALVNGDWTAFDLDTVKLLMTLFDSDRSGTIGFPEFVGLYNYIREWQGVFRRFDRDGSGSIDVNELQVALQSFGFNLNPRLVDLVQKKYDIKATSSGRGIGANGITFDRFVRACVVIKQIHESYIRWDSQRRGYIQLTYEDFMSTVLTLP